MRLLFSHTSPYARKVRVVILEKGLHDRVELIPVITAENPVELLAANPLGLIPTLLRDNGESLIDSPVICQYLDGISGEPRLIPGDFDGQIETMHRVAMADGITDIALGMVMEKRKPPSQIFAPLLERRSATVLRTVERLEAESNLYIQPVPDLGVIALACALEYLDFRLPELEWRTKAPRLAVWATEFGKRPSMQATQPRDT